MSRDERLSATESCMIQRHRCELCDRVFECAMCTEFAIAANVAGIVSGSLYAPAHRAGDGENATTRPVLVCERCRS